MQNTSEIITPQPVELIASALLAIQNACALAMADVPMHAASELLDAEAYLKRARVQLSRSGSGGG
jgi:hypothetical protein